MDDDADSRETYEQNVTAVSGNAYGALGADIHVLPGGNPQYFIRNWPHETTLDAGALPGAEAAQDGGADSQLATLRRWRDGRSRLAVRWLQGSSWRHAAQPAATLASDSIAARWKVVEALHGPDNEWPVLNHQDLSPAGTAGLLAIVWHADEWATENLTWLLKNVLFHQAETRCRILMTAHSADQWPKMQGILDAHQATTSAQQVRDLIIPARSR